MKKETILIVEDEDIARLTTTAFLKKWGYTVIIASNGAEAIKKCENYEIDLILMDIQMPHMNGIDAGQEITKKNRIPILYITSTTEDDILNDAIRRGGFGYLIKPLDPEQLKPAIVSCIGRGKEVKKLNNTIKDERVIHCAVGIIMERHHLDYESAKKAINGASRKELKKLNQMAKSIINITEEKNTLIRNNSFLD